MDRGASPTLDFSEILAQAGWLRRIARGLCADADLADDAVQETLITGHQRPPTHHEARGWLGTVLRNRLRQEARRDAAHRRAALAAQQEPGEGARSPEQIATLVSLQRRLAQLLEELPEDQRQVIVLRYIEDLDSVTIGKRLSLPAGTVRWRLKTALDELRRRLDEDDARTPNRPAWRRVLLPLMPAAVEVPRPGLEGTSVLSLGKVAVVTLAGTVALGLALALTDGAGAWTSEDSRRTPDARVAAARSTEAASAAIAGRGPASPSPLPVFAAPPTEQPPAPERSAPFSMLRWQGDRPEVRLGDGDGPLLTLTSIDGRATAEIVAFAQREYRSRWQKRIAEDLPEVMAALGRPISAQVRLGLVDPNGVASEVTAAMTVENRRKLWQASLKPKDLIDRFARVAPWSDVRFVVVGNEGNEVIEVQIDRRWHQLLGAGGVPIGQLVAKAKERWPNEELWKERIAVDLSEVVALVTGSSPGLSIALDLIQLDTGRPLHLEAAPMTENNRIATKRRFP